MGRKHWFKKRATIWNSRWVLLCNHIASPKVQSITGTGKWLLIFLGNPRRPGWSQREAMRCPFNSALGRWETKAGKKKCAISGKFHLATLKRKTLGPSGVIYAKQCRQTRGLIPNPTAITVSQEWSFLVNSNEVICYMDTLHAPKEDEVIYNIDTFQSP